MKKDISATLFLVLVIWPISFSALASTNYSSIYFRHIIYFFPQSDKIDVKALPAVPKGFSKVEELPEESDSTAISFQFLEDFKEYYPVPDLNYLSYSGRGLSREQAESIQGSDYALMIDAVYPTNTSPLPVKQVSELVFDIASEHNGLIYDSETRELFTPEAWRYRRVDGWQSELPIMDKHTTIHAYQTDNGIRAITLGMRKFGLPDIVINSFVWSQNDSVGSLINLVSQVLAEGGRPTENDEMRLQIDELADTEFKQNLIASLYPNASKDVSIKVADGVWEEGDPYNTLLEILFDDGEGDSRSAKQENLIHSLFGWKDEIAYIDHNEEILAASERAKQKLPSLKKAFNKGLAPGEYIQLKAPFARDDEGNEWMWVEVMEWQEGTIKGLLLNEPYFIESLKAGSEVTIQQNEVFDYIRNYPDGTSEGNETGALIYKYQQ